MQDTAKPATRVLIVDDHPVVLSGCRTLFASDHSIRIEEATDAKSGHRAYVSKRPDVIVIDISLPDVSGFELMRRIRKDDPDAKIIMFSMNDDPAFVVRAVELGAQGYVSKGDDPRILLKAVRKVVAPCLPPTIRSASMRRTTPNQGTRPISASGRTSRSSTSACPTSRASS